MPINPQIALQTEAPRIQDPMQTYQGAMQLRNMAQQNQMGDVQLRNAQMQNQALGQDQQDQQAWQKAFLENKGNPGATLKAIAPIVSPKFLISMTSATNKQLEEESKKTSAEMDLEAKRNARLADLASNVTDDNSLKMAVGLATKEGLIKPEEAQQLSAQPFSPEIQQYLGTMATMLRTHAENQSIEAFNKKKTEDALLDPLKLREQSAKTTTAEQAAAGTQPITPFQQAGLDKKTPGVDIPFPQSVENQKARISAAGKEGTGMLGGGALYAGSTQGVPSQRNDDLLKSMPAGRANIIKAMVDGKYPMPTGNALRSGAVLGLLQDAAQYEPGFDASTWRTRLDTRVDFAKGNASKQVLRMNTLIKHLGTVWESGSS
jgi:hypothetical protein